MKMIKHNGIAFDLEQLASLECRDALMMSDVYRIAVTMRQGNTLELIFESARERNIKFGEILKERED